MFWYPPAWVWLGICIVGRVVVGGGVILWLVFLPDRLQAGIFPPGSLLFLLALLVNFSRTFGETDAVFSDKDLLWKGSIGRRNLPAMSSPTESKWAGPKNRWRPQEFHYLPMTCPGPPGEIGKRSVNRKRGRRGFADRIRFADNKCRLPTESLAQNHHWNPGPVSWNGGFSSSAISTPTPINFDSSQPAGRNTVDSQGWA
jgi:hypothetical protein